MSKREIKATTYDRLTKLIIFRLETIEKSVNELSKLEELTPVQRRTLSSYNTEIKNKLGDFDANVRRLLEGSGASEIDDATLSSQQDKVYTLYTNVASMLEVLQPPVEATTPSVASEAASARAPPSQVKLPKIELQKFSGDLSTWVSYINLYDTAIHKNPNLSAIAKFQYLISTLSGEALGLVKSLSLTAANYFVAYNLLRDRFHNERRLVTLHLNTLIDLPEITQLSIKGLRQFVTSFTEHTQALNSLECDMDCENNPLLSAMLLRKLDSELRKKLESHRVPQNNDATNHSLPSAKDIMSFLNTECNQTEDAELHASIAPSKSNSSSFKRSSTKQVRSLETKPCASKRNVSFHSALDVKSNVSLLQPCFVCKQNGHKVYSCVNYKAKTPQERFKTVKENKRCISCLGAHDLPQCTSRGTCFKCQKRHHTTLHFEKSTDSTRPVSPRLGPSRVDTPVVTLAHKTQTSQHSNYTVLLGTALVKLTAQNGNSYVFRALLDSGSMLNFISEPAAQLLGGPRNKSNLQITGISHTSSNTKGHMDLKVTSLSDYLITPQQSFHILNKITTNLPRTRLSQEVFDKVRPFVLADPTFHLPGNIDVLIGGSLFPYLFTNQIHQLGLNLPCAVGTHFGFVVMGTAPCIPEILGSTHFMSLLSTSDIDLHANLQRFWLQEELPVCGKKTEEDRKCDQHFETTHYRNNDGRYVVRLPFQEKHSSLGSSRSAAERRLHSLERKFSVQQEFSILYHNFMKEYLSLGHMAKCQNIDLTSPHYFLPHHGVLKQNSITTKLRTVFDASSKSSTGTSLNDILLTGPKLQTNICDILLHFRSHNIVFSCDIRHMYRQILIHPSDRRFQLILWRDSLQEEISTFELNTVTYGMNSSPYLAIRTLHQLADDEGINYPAAANILRTQTYVDDIITGADTEDEAMELQKQLISLLRRGGFELRKWASNSSRLLQDLPEGHRETPVFLHTSQQPSFSILGLHWTPDSDCFTYSLNMPIDDRPTKRSVLSLIAKIYDPCGFLCPCLMLAKCFMQYLWTTGVTWDEPLDPDLAEKWQLFVAESRHLSKLAIPRAFQFGNAHLIDLHGFADASENGYAAVIYFRIQLQTGSVIMRPVVAKTRVAPLKRVTLPRLELCAAHLLAQLVSYCQTIFSNKIKFNDVCLWTDSSVVLTWIRTPPYRLKTFIANRVSQIQEIIHPEAWRHISSRDNPADCASRGIHASQLVTHPLWWTGPSWLQLPSTAWPTSRFQPVDLATSEGLKETPFSVLTSAAPEEWSLLNKYSSWFKLQRVMAYVLRFVNNCRTNERHSGVLHVSELNQAKVVIFKLVQRSSFHEDITRLNKQCDCSVKLRRLRPFMSWDGLLRVGGRLSQASLDISMKHPILLPKSHYVTSLLIDHTHVTNLHAGPQL